MNQFARKHPQLSVEEMQQLKWLLGGILTLLSVSTVLYMDVNAWALTALTSVGVVANLVRPSWLARIPHWVHRLAFPFIAGIFAIDLWVTGELLPSMVRLDVILLLYRTLIFRQKRDDLQLIVLGLFLVVVAGVLTVSLVFALQILAFAAVALVFLLTITLAEATGVGDSGTTPVAMGMPPAWARHIDWRRLLERVRQVTDWRIVALGAGLFVGLVGLSGLLFLAIPRFQLENGLFLDRLITKKAHTGFSDSIRFGDVTEIQQDNSVALSVDVSDRSQVPTEPYWRMLVLDDYREGTFRLSPTLVREAFDRERNGMVARGALAEQSGEPVFWTFYLESGVSRFLPTLGAFERTRFREPQTFRVARRLSVIALRNEPVTMTAYRVEGLVTSSSTPDPAFGVRLRKDQHESRAASSLMLDVGGTTEDRAVLQRILAEISGRMGATANPGESGKLGEARPVGAMPVNLFAERTSAWLAEHHTYSLKPRIPDGAGDPLVRWLSSQEGGHCELFAGSLVLLARTAGIPARVVTGFRGGSWNGYSNNFTLRNSDAHAWCELFDAKTDSWQRADPTPGARPTGENDTKGEGALTRRLDRSWTARLDSIRVFWYRRIVNFDQQSQFETLRAVKDATEESGKRVRAALERAMAALRSIVTTPWNARRAGWILLIVAGAFAAVMAVKKFRFAFYKLRIGPGIRRGDAVRNEAGHWLSRLSDAGVNASGAIGRDGHGNVVTELQRLRFGRKESWGDVALVFRDARKALQESRRQRRKSAIER